MAEYTISIKNVIAPDSIEPMPELDEKIRKAMVQYWDTLIQHQLAFGVPDYMVKPKKRCSCRGVMHWPDCELGLT